MPRITLGRVSSRPGDVPNKSVVSSSLPSLQFITSVTATGGTQISSGALNPGDLVGYKVFLSGIRTATLCEVGLQTSSDGINYSASNGAYSITGIGNGATTIGSFTRQGTAATVVALTLTAEGLLGGGTASNAGNLSGEIDIWNLTGTQENPLFNVRTVLHGSAEVAGLRGHARRTSPVGVQGILLIAGSVFRSGRMDIYGIRSA